MKATTAKAPIKKLIDLAQPSINGEVTYAEIVAKFGENRKYSTDKFEHGYLPFYQKYLPKSIEKLLEWGVWQGEGIRLFRDFYEKKGEFHAADWFRGSVVSENILKEQGFITYVVNEDDPSSYLKIKDKFDVVVEDSSHHSDAQISNFVNLFTRNVKPGGLYIAEDLHCCKDKFWWRSVTSYEGTLLSMLEKAAGEGKKLINDEITQQVDKIKIHAINDNSIIAFIWKKR